jgi:hypothetical protein
MWACKVREVVVWKNLKYLGEMPAKREDIRKKLAYDIKHDGRQIIFCCPPTHSKFSVWIFFSKTQQKPGTSKKNTASPTCTEKKEARNEL